MCRKMIFPACLILALGVINAADGSLVGWWKLDETSGSVAYDSSSYGNDGTFNGTPQWVAGKVGGALEFDGGDFVSVPGVANINPEAITLMTWVNFSAVDVAAMERQDYLSRGDDYAFSLHEWAADGKIHGIVTSAGGWSVVNGATVVEPDTWYHTAMTYDPGTQMLILYLDGEQDGELSVPSGLEHRFGGPLTMGTFSGRDLLGRLDEVKIFDTALSQEEIKGALSGKGFPYAFSPSPADGAIYEDTWVTLSWTPGADAASHDVYVGDNFAAVNDGTGDTFQGNQTSPSFVLGIPGFSYPEGLVPGTTYYWRIDEVNNLEPDSPWRGDVWRFNIPPKTSYAPNPPDGARFVNPNVTLSWLAGFGAILHTVHFGDNFDAVNNAALGTPQGLTTYDPGPLELNTTYYWRVDEIGADGIIYRGDIWNFEIRGEIPRPIEQDEQLIRNYTPAAWQAEDVQWGRDVDPHNKVDDIIDRSDANSFDVVVNYKRAVQDGDIDFLNSVGAQSEVQMRLKYLSSVAVGGLTKDDVLAIAADFDVAFIEQQFGFAPTLDVSVPGICVTPAAGGCATTVPAGTDGSGVNIVIMDSGVDNTVHDAFPASQYVDGYDAVTGTFTDPDDDMGHGTHVASIALGQATTNTSRGVAPGAGLIDVRVFDAATICSTAAWVTVTDGLQTTYDNRITWGVDVINMSIGQCNAAGRVMSEGLDAFSQLVDLAESMGIVVVAAAGNEGPNNNGLASPGAATRAITVAASNHRETVTRADDGIAIFSSRGPRHNDNDADDIDELKPEVTAPGNNIPFDDGTFDNDAADADTFTATETTAQVAAAAGVTINVTSSADIAAGEIIGLFDQFWPNNLREQVTVATSAGAGGTSFTTTTTSAHPTGTIVWELEPRGIFAAQHNTTNQGILMPGTSMAAPHVAGLAALVIDARPGINAASVKDLIISTAELPFGTPASRPAIDATWNEEWGWGLVNASAAINLATQTDLTFPHHPASPGWLSPDISHTKPLKVGQTATVTVAIRNNGPNPANNVRVHFGVHVYSAATPTFYDIGTEIVNIPVNATGQTTVSTQWVPLAASHQCLKVEIGYSPDTDYSNNCAQRNVTVALSPVQFRVRNTLTEEPARIDLVGILEDPDAGWSYRIDPPFVMLAASDPPAEIEAELYPPADAPPGAQQTLHIAAVIDTNSGAVELGGISVEHTVPR